MTFPKKIRNKTHNTTICEMFSLNKNQFSHRCRFCCHLFTCCSVLFINVWYFIIIIILSLIPFFKSTKSCIKYYFLFLHLHVCKKRVFSKCVINRYQTKKKKENIYVALNVLDCYHVIFFYNLWFMYYWQHELKVQVRYVKWVLIFQCEFLMCSLVLFFCLIISTQIIKSSFSLFSLMIMEEYCSYLKPLIWEEMKKQHCRFYSRFQTLMRTINLQTTIFYKTISVFIIYKFSHEIHSWLICNGRLKAPYSKHIM